MVNITKDTVISHDGAKIGYSVAGDGPAIILLHGFGLDGRVWEENGFTEKLASRFRVIAIDIRGFGYSDCSHDPEFYALDNILNDIKSVAKKCDAESFALMGHSYGATITIRAVKAGLPITKAISASGNFDNDFFVNTIPKWIKYYGNINDMKKTGKYSGLSEEMLEFAKNTDLDSYLAMFDAWLKYEAVSPEEIKVPMFAYSGTEDYAKARNYLLNNDRILHDNGISYKIYEGMTHHDLVVKSEIIVPDVIDFILK